MSEPKMFLTSDIEGLWEFTKLFDVGAVLFVSSGVVALLDGNQQWELLTRHWGGDFGGHGNFWDIADTLTNAELEHGSGRTNEKGRLNAIAIVTKGNGHNNVISVYAHEDETFYIGTYIGKVTALFLYSECDEFSFKID